MPGSIQAVLAARLDALPRPRSGSPRTPPSSAASSGTPLIAHLGAAGHRPDVGELLRRLRVKELVVPRSRPSLAGAAEFGFRHVLIRDVAYDSLPKRDRAAKHLAVAPVGRARVRGPTEEFAELLASHYLAALRYRRSSRRPERLASCASKRTHMRGSRRSAPDAFTI